ncbi:alpha/beta hydrolase [Porticoccaceae bacterium]|nr:alpha/beta hydrolase [Porticoccaceae bacterium]
MIIFFLSTLVVSVLLSIMITLVYLRRFTQRRNKIIYRVKDTKKGIDVMEYPEIGGVKQCLHIRGRSRENPVLLFIHGGPGISQIGWYDEFQRPWEDYFTIVQWDQRQTGKSYMPLKKVGYSLTNEQMANDAEDVIAYLRQRLNKEKIVVMGWSYGSYLGMKMVERRPEWLYAYVGVGQSVNVAESIIEEHALLLAYAKKQDNQALIVKLEAMLPRLDSNNSVESFVQHGYTIACEMDKIINIDVEPNDFPHFITSSRFLSHHYTWRDLWNTSFGDTDSLTSPEYTFGSEFMSIDLPAEIGSSFQVPIIFMTGAHDWHVPYTLTDAWFKNIQAPYKEQIWFENSAHFAIGTEPGRFLVALVEKVLPLTKGLTPEANQSKNATEQRSSNEKPRLSHC